MESRDIDTFMTGYWKSEEPNSWVRVDHSRLAGVLDRYRRNYPDGKAMGRLTFSNLEAHIVCPDSAFVLENSNSIAKRTSCWDLYAEFRKFAEGGESVADHTTDFLPDPRQALVSR